MTDTHEVRIYELGTDKLIETMQLSDRGVAGLSINFDFERFYFTEDQS